MKPFDEALAAARAELEVREEFPPEVIAEADGAQPSPVDRADRTDVPLVTIDPPGSRDLDQAVHLERAGSGITVVYAIADVAAWVPRGGAVEAEAWKRGVTFYAPDRSVPLYPPVLSHDRASLLPDARRPAIVFDLRIDGSGELVEARIGRGWVRSRAQLTYADASAPADPARESAAARPWREPLALLRDFGELRERVEAARGGVSLPIREQNVVRRAGASLGYDLAYESPVASEGWNAQVSLLTGHVAAVRMLAAGVGLLRTTAPRKAEDEERFRRAARAMGFAWPEEVSYAGFLHGLDIDHPHAPALVWQARRIGGGADYVHFDGALPEHPEHAALAFPYAHVTAPLRRLADRYVLDLLVALERGEVPTAEDRATLRSLPEVMNGADTRQGRLERRVVDLAEVWALRDLEGQTFRAVAIGSSGRGVEVQLEEPAFRGMAVPEEGAAEPPLGGAVAVRVERVSPEEGTVELRLVEVAP